MNEDYGDRLRNVVRQLEADAAEALAQGGEEAALRVGMDQALNTLAPDLKFLRQHGFQVDGGSYFLGCQIMALALRGVDPRDAVHDPLVSRLLREYVERAAKL